MLYHAMLSRDILRLMRKLIRPDLVWSGFTSVSHGKQPLALWNTTKCKWRTGVLQTTDYLLGGTRHASHAGLHRDRCRRGDESIVLLVAVAHAYKCHLADQPSSLHSALQLPALALVHRHLCSKRTVGLGGLLHHYRFVCIQSHFLPYNLKSSFPSHLVLGLELWCVQKPQDERHRHLCHEQEEGTN